MAQLAIAALGAGLGSAAGIGASAGWLIGSLVGQLLFPTKGPNTEGPRLSDLSVQSAAEGADIPIVFGRMRIAGNMIWTSGIREVRTKKKQGGKGMGGSSTHTSYTYNASFAIGLCEGPIQGVRKIWADGKLIYDNSANASAGTLYVAKKKAGAITIYLGSETQLADPTIAAAVGAADCPAHRGLAYIVFKQLQLADFGNRIPNITAEVVTGTEGAYLWRVNTWPQNFSSDGYEVADGVVRVVNREAISGSSWRVRTREYDFSGNLLRDTYGPTHTLFGTTVSTVTSITNRPRIGLINRTSIGVSPGMQQWVYDENIVEDRLTVGPFGDHPGPAQPNPNGVYYNGYLYVSVQGLDETPPRRAANGIVRFPVSRGIAPAGQPDRYFNCAAAGLCTPRGATSNVIRRIIITDEGTLLCMVHSENIITYHMLEFDQDLNFIKGWQMPDNYSDVGWGVRNGRFFVQTSGSGDGYFYLRLYEEQTPGVLNQVQQRTLDNSQPGGILASLGGGLVLTRFGVYSIYPPVTPPSVTVGSIVSALCQRCGLSGGDIDVTSLTDVVPGYGIGRAMTGRAAIEPLARAWPFDAVESDGLIVFDRRPGTVRATLTDDDLGAGVDQPARDLVLKRRQQELELPTEIRLSYLDADNDYQPGVQSARRISASGKAVVDIDLSIAMSSQQAAQAADTLLRNVWAERDSFEGFLTRKWARLDPVDLVVLPGGEQARLTVIDYAEPALVRFEAVRDVDNAYVSLEVGNDVSQNTPQQLEVAGPTRIEFLDLPPLRDSDGGAGFYIAACGYFPGWRGCEVLRSGDDGTTFDEVTVIVDDATMGVTTTALGAPGSVNLLDVGSAVTVDLVTPGATLSSISDAALLAGGNACLIGNEILQFGTATLNVDGTYTLSRLLRGRLGTEAATGSHVNGERFVLLDNNVKRVDDGQSNNGVPFVYRAVTFSNALDDGTEQNFSSVGRSQQNPAPADLLAVPIYTSESWELTWRRRNRLSWWWADSGDSPLDNAVEQYEIEICDLAGNVKSTHLSSSRSFVYTKAQQVVDFTVGVLTFVYRIRQVCDGGVRGLTAEAVALPPARGRYVSMHRTLCPVLYWRNIFDATPDDDSGNNYDGSSSGTFTANQTDIPVVNETSSTAFKSVTMGGGYLQRADSGSPLLDIATNVVSLSIWVKFTTTDNTRTIMGKWDGAVTADQSYRLQIGTTAGSLRFQVMSANGIRTAQHAGGYNDGQWHHVVGVYAAGVISLFVDGVLRTTSTGTDQLVNAGAANFRVGQNSNGTEVYNGQICEVAVHAKELTATIIENLYKTARGLP